MKGIGFVGVFCLCLLFSTSNVVAGVTYFSPTDIAGDSNTITASAQASITSGAGYIDILLTNTSPLGLDISPDGRANPFIMEIEFKYVTGYTLDESAGASYVRSLSDTLFAQGAGNTAVNYAARDLYYNLVAPDSSGMDKCFMTANADNIRNDNTIGSVNLLDGSDIPQEGWAQGFLNTQPDQYSGTVFDTVLFHLAFNESGTPDADFYLTPDTIIVKYVGGGDYSMHVANVPEPITIALFGLGALAISRKRKK